MLLKRTNDLISELKDYKKLKVLTIQSNDFQDRYNNVEAVYKLLEDARGKKVLFSQNGIDNNLVDVFSGLNSLVQSVISLSKDDSAKLLEAHEFWKTNHDYLTKETDRILLFNWKSYIDKELTYKNRNDLDIYETIPELSDTAKILQNYLDDVSEIKEHLPSLNEIHKVKHISNEMKKFVEEIDKVGIPDEVSEFLAKASTTGISLADIDAELIDWLKQHDMLQYCQIRLRNND